MNLIILIVLAMFLLTLIILAALYIAWSAKKTLLTEQTAWSARGVKIKRRKKVLNVDANKDAKLLETITIQSDDFLKDLDNNDR